MRKLNTKDFSTFTMEEMVKEPNKQYFNTKEKKMKVIGVRKETTIRPKRDARTLINEIKECFEKNPVMSIRFNITLEELAELIDKKKVIINDSNSTMDKIQRSFVMGNKKKSDLAVSIINGDDTMPDIDMVLSEDENGVLTIYINDGMQRTNTLYDFIKGNLKINSKLCPQLKDKTFFDLPEEIQMIVEKRMLCFKIGHPITERWRSETFKTLNCTSTKMSDGEKLNASFYDSEIYQKSLEIVSKHRVLVSNTFDKTDEDKRNGGVMNFLYALAVHYYTDMYKKMPAGNKKDIVNKFLEETKINDEIELLIRETEENLASGERIFGDDFCHGFAKDDNGFTVNCTGNDLYEKSYHPVVRTKSVRTGLLVPTFHIMMKYGKTIDALSKINRQKLVTKMEMYYTDSEYREKYSTNMHGQKILDRNNDVAKKCAEILATM